MKLKNIIICGLSLTALTACNDYLDVEAPSKVTDEQIFSSTDEADRLLNSVYESLCSSNTYGSAYLTTFNFNSDVEFATSSSEIQSASHNEWKLFDGEADGSNVKSTWDAAYETIERANNFVNAAEQSQLYGDEDLYQMIGEAKCIRAMNYLDLVTLWGDVPFTFTRTYEQESLIMPMSTREEILTALINDLKEAAPKMKPSDEVTEGVERCTKEYAWALIARIALYRAGYSLHPGESASDVGTMTRANDYAEYYQIARTYCDSVMKEGTHSLTADYFDVFTNECNYTVVNDDDVIFEIPFVLNVNGNLGYYTGPQCNISDAGDTDHAWGRATGALGLNAFYRFTFNEQDVRRNVAGFWSYAYTGVPTILNSYTNYSMKWSKLWDKSHTMGNTSTGSTGINFPYMRYADVLLMFAEAENEINNGPTEAAKDALKQVRSRAFRTATNKAEMVDGYVDKLTTKEDFFNAIVDERAWEFGGENLRWKDLVRWNLYNQVVYKTFWQYYGMAAQDYSYDFDDKYDTYPTTVYYKARTRSEWNALVAANPEKYNATNYPEIFNMPNTDSQIGVLEFYHYDSDTLKINNLWEPWGLHTKEMSSVPITGSDAWTEAILFSWQSDGLVRAQCRCSLRGYIYIDEGGTIYPSSMPDYSSQEVLKTLPPVRYILPIPTDVVSRSLGQYKNYYGY